MCDTTIAAKLPRQLESFLGKISPHFHKPVVRFIGDMIYGIMVEKDVKLASIVRALKEGISPKKVEDRLSRMLSSTGLETGLHGFIASEGAGRVRKDTLVVLDPSDVQSPERRTQMTRIRNLRHEHGMPRTETRSAFPQSDFHLAQRENRDAALYLEGRRFSCPKNCGTSNLRIPSWHGKVKYLLLVKVTCYNSFTGNSKTQECAIVWV